jgi:hypothetical protein
MKSFKNRKIFLAVLTLCIVFFCVFLGYRWVSKVSAEDIYWVQTDWSGGSSVSLVGNLPKTYLQESGLVLSGTDVQLYTEADWPTDLLGWYYKKSFTVDNTSDSILDDYVFKIDVPYDANMNSDFSDIRFTQADGTVLSYWVEEYTDSVEALIWVKISTLEVGSNVLYMYYGNSNSTSESNGKNVFIFFDDFDSTTLDQTVWGGSNLENFYHQDGKLVVNSMNNSWNSVLYTQEIFERDNLELAMDYKWVSNNASYDAMMMTWHDNTTYVSYQGMLYGYYNNGTGSGTTVQQTIYESGSNKGGTSYNWTQGLDYQVRSRMKAEGGALYQFKLENDSDWTTAYDSNNSNASARIGWSIHSGEHHFDNVRIRKWYAAEPASVEWGSVTDYSSFSGVLESNVFDTTFPSDWGVLSYTFSGSTDFQVRVRSFNNSDKSDAPEWVGCEDLSSGIDLSESSCVTDEHQYLQYRVSFNMVDGLSPILEEISFSFSASDQTPPTTNASNIQLGNSVTSGEWINFEPIITWDIGSDDINGGGLLGYCIALDEVDISASTASLDPELTAGTPLEGLDDGINNDACPFIITSSSIDLSTIDDLNLDSNHKYYFSIKAVDLAGNVWNGDTASYQDLVWFKYDVIKPKNVMYISTPSSTFGSVNDMFFNWPTTGQAIASDSESDILGWQYAINSISSENWRGTTYDDFLDLSYIPVDSGINIIQLEEDVHGGSMVIGNNTIYFRAIDNAGNHSTYVTGGINYGGEAPDFPAESVVTITPQTSDSNNFALSWLEAEVADGKTLQSYYYMINTEPPSNVDTLTSNGSIYRPTMETSIDQRLLAGAVKGENSVYVVAIDSDDNYSPTNAIHGTFTLDSELPDPPLNFSISDTSIKEAKLWRAALTWEEPSYIGNGDITYIIEKSLDGISWIELDRISGNAYSDISESSREYYYRVATVDSSDESMNNPSYSISLNITPEGRFTSPAELVSKPVVSDVTTRMAKISWSTDRNSDSKLQYGLSSGQYFDSEIYTSTQTTEHILDMNNLLPGITYYVRAKWTDIDGNTGTSSEFIVQTKPAPVVEDVLVDTVGLNYAIIKLTTKGATQARIVYGLTKNYGGSQEINTSTESSEYSIMLRELEDGTDYHYKIVLTDEEGFEYESFEDHVFSTPPRPQVSNVQIQEKKGVPTPTIEVFWESNIPVNSIVRYSHDGKSLDKVDMELKEGEHVMEIEGLDSNSAYQLIVEGVDAMGNRAVSEVYAFTTATDTRPPEVYGIKSEGDIQSSDIQTDRSRSAQLIISWETDEPSTSQVMYGEGAANDGYPYSTQTDSEMRYKHVIIVSNLSPSKVYHFKVVSKDSAGNVGESGSVTSITPKSTDTVMESVLGSLGRIFNFF